MKIKLYANENFPRAVVEELRQLGYDVLTAFEVGQANQGIPDEEVLNFSSRQQRAVITLNRKDFIALHKTGLPHSGIVVCRRDNDFFQLAQRIDRELKDFSSLANELVRVNKL
jgi:hypothetical protein